MAGKGGKRPGAGRKKGYKAPQTLSKLMARAELQRLVIEALGPLVEAQIANAKGLRYLVTRDKKTGKFLRVGEAAASNPEEETIEVWEKDPSVQAFDSLVEQALDKAAQHIALTGKDDGPLEIVIRKPWAKSQKS